MENKLTVCIREARSEVNQINMDLRRVKVISPEQRNHILDIIDDIQWKSELAETILRRRH